MIKGIPITALLSNNKLQDSQEIPEALVAGSFLKPWQEIVKVCRLNNEVRIMRWCAYDLDFFPQIEVMTYLRYGHQKGLTTYYLIVHRSISKKL